MIEIRINGSPKSVPPSLNVFQLMELLEISKNFVMIEKNGCVVAREEFDQIPVEKGDVFEMVQLRGGG